MGKGNGVREMVQELDVARIVGCPMDNDESVNADEQCPFCAYFRGLGDNGFTLKSGFEDKEKNEDHADEQE